MVSKYSSVILLLGIIGISSGLRDDYFNCPKDADAINEVADIRRQVPANIFGYVTLSIRIPESGLLSGPITCIMVTDLSSDGEGGEIDVKGGGLGAKYVVIKIVSKFLRGLDYQFEVWTA